MTDDEQRKYALVLFRGSKYAELRKAIRGKKCFSELLPIAEKAGAIEYWDHFVEDWRYHAGCEWSGVTDKMRRKAFEKMKNDERICHAGRDWEGITDKMRMKALKKNE